MTTLEYPWIQTASVVNDPLPIVTRPQTRELVLALVASGMPKRQISRELLIARSRVREIVAAARGAPKRRTGRRGG